MSNSEAWGIAMVGFLVGFIAAAAMSLLWTEPLARTEGYCAALNGERISNSVCNVDGKVVMIP